MAFTRLVIQPQLTFADFVPQYLGIVKGNMSPTTFEFYERTIERLLIPEFGHIRIADIKPLHIQNFIRKLSETTAEAKNKDIEAHALTPATIRRYVTCLKSIFKQAMKLDLISVNPTNSEKISLPKIIQPKIEIFTKQEAQEIMNCLLNESLQFQVMIQIAIITGARRGELVGLKFSDIDFDNKKITIERSAIKLKGKPIATKEPKDYEIRTISVNDYCIQLIKLLQEEKEKEKEQLGESWVGNNWLFTQMERRNNEPSDPYKMVFQIFSKAQSKAQKIPLSQTHFRNIVIIRRLEYQARAGQIRTRRYRND